MNKTELLDQIADSTDLPKASVSKTIDAALIAITGALARGEPVTLAGFGSFTVSDRPARTGRNPRTGEALEIAASRAPKFAPGKPLKDAVNA